MPTAQEAKGKNIDKMGQALGSQFSELWQGIVQVHMVWSEYVELYGTKPDRVEMLNASASNFFYMVQQVLWEATMLGICRLTDRSEVAGKSNLTIQNLYSLIDDPKLKGQILRLVDAAISQSEFCRDWRNRYIAHRDLDVALGSTATPLAAGTIKDTTSAIKALADVLNAIEAHYMDSETAYDFAKPLNGALTLLYVLDDGLTRKREREERIQQGKILDSDLQRDL
jgi:hypothetical protein